MRQHLNITLTDAGVPRAEVPGQCMWDLVEYLSYQRVTVSYQYESSHFTVTFPRQDAQSAQRILDDWSRISELELQPA